MHSRSLPKSLAEKMQAIIELRRLTLAFRLTKLVLLVAAFSVFTADFAYCCSPLQSNASGHQDYLNVKKEYLLAIQAESLKRSKDPIKTQQAFQKLHNKYVSVSTHVLKRHNWSRLHREAKAFLKLKPTESFSKIVAGKIIAESRLSPSILENCKLIRQAANQMEGYSLEARLYASDAAVATVEVADNLWPKGRMRLADRQLNLLIEWMCRKNSPERLQRLMFEQGQRFIRSTAAFKILPKVLKKLEAADGKMKPWLRSMLIAELQIGTAWAKFGFVFNGRNANKEARKQFDQKLVIAERELKSAYQSNPERPEAAAAMVRIAKTGNTDGDARTWFDRAVSAEFDYMPAYDNYRQVLGPRWGGSHEAMIDFGNECAATKRYDTRVPFVFKAVYSDIYNELVGRYSDELKQPLIAEYVGKFDVYSQIRKICENYETYIKQSEGFTVTDAKFYRGTSFTVAYKLGQLDDAYQLIKKYRGDVLTAYEKPSNRTSNEVLIAHVIAANGAAGDKIQLIEEQTSPILGRDRTFDESKELLSEIEEAEAVNDLPGAQPYFDFKKESLANEIKFHRGDWLDIEFTPDLRHWTNLGGRYQVESPTSLYAASADNEEQYLSFNTSFPPPYEIEFTVECLKSFYIRNSLWAGLSAGRVFGPSNGRVFWVDTLGNKFGVMKIQSSEPIIYTEDVKSFQMRATLFNGYYELTDGEGHITRLKADDFKPGRIAFGLPLISKQSGEVRYSDIRIRKLDMPDPPAADDFEGRKAFYLKRLEKEKTYESYIWLATAYFDLKQFEKAVETYEVAEKILPKRSTPTLLKGIARVNLGDYETARITFERALKKSNAEAVPDRVLVLEQLIWLYATYHAKEFRSGRKALKYVKQTEKLLGKKSKSLDQLDKFAAAHAEAGQFKIAVKLVEAAIKRSQFFYKDRLEGLQQRLKLYQAGKPYHDE